VSKSEWCKAGIIANRKVLPIDNAENRSEAAIGDICLASVFNLEIGDLEWALRKPDLLAFRFSHLRAGRNAEIPLRVEGIRVLPVDRVETGTSVRRADIAMALQRKPKPLLRRCAISACPGIPDCGDAAAIRRNYPEQFHDQQFQRRKSGAIG